MIATATLAGYDAVENGVALADASRHGRIRLTQRDRADLLHRLSTNDIAGLTPGMGRRTVMVNHNARILDLLTVYHLPEHLLVETQPGQAAALVQLLRRNIFFRDQVRVEDVTATTVQRMLYGPQAAALLSKLTSLEVADWPLHHIQAVRIGSQAAWLARSLPLGGDGWSIFAEDAAWNEMAAAFADVPVLDDGTLAVLRIEAGYPAWGSELSVEYIPLETRLTDAVSFTKGCYVGQEIIARMDSRQRLAKQLMVLRPAAPVETPTPLTLNGKDQGTFTSLADSPRHGLIGLGYVRTAHAHAGVKLMAGDIEVEVGELP